MCRRYATLFIFIATVATGCGSPVEEEDFKDGEDGGGTAVYRDLGPIKVDLWQRGSVEVYDAGSVVEATLGAEPFDMVVSPVAKDFPVRITAWTDDSIFKEVTVGREISEVPFFQPGTGMATKAGVVTELYLNREAHNYFHEERLYSYSNYEATVRVESIYNVDTRKEWKMADHKGTVYVVVFVNGDADGTIGEGAFVKLVLRF